MNEETFSILHEVMVRKFENRNMEVDKHSDYLRIYALSDGSWDYKEILDELRTVKLQDVEVHSFSKMLPSTRTLVCKLWTSKLFLDSNSIGIYNTPASRSREFTSLPVLRPTYSEKQCSKESNKLNNLCCSAITLYSALK